MTATSPVVASSPFLTVDQAAAELGLHPNAIPRLIGLKALDGLRQPNSGEWKVLPAALTKFLAAGSPRGKNDLVDYDGAWYADRTLQSYAGQFENQVRDLLLSFFPATMPYGNIRHGDRRMLTLTAEQKNAIMSVGAQPPLTTSFTKAEPGPVFRSRSHQYVAATLLRLVAQEATPTLTDAINKGLTPWKVLFDSPESYRGCVDRAWTRAQQATIGVWKQYTIGQMLENATLTVDWPISLFGGSLSELEKLIF